MSFLEMSFALDDLDPEQAEAACFESGALSVTLSHEGAADSDAPLAGAVYEPAPGEVRLWNHTRLKALFAAEQAGVELIVGLARRLGREPAQLQAHAVAERAWEREWLRDFHAMRFGRRLCRPRPQRPLRVAHRSQSSVSIRAWRSGPARMRARRCAWNGSKAKGYPVRL